MLLKRSVHLATCRWSSSDTDPVEATHAVLREAAQPSEGPPASSLKVPEVLQAVPAPAERAAVHQLSTAQHGSCC